MSRVWDITFLVAFILCVTGVIMPHIFDPDARYLEYVNPDGSHIRLIHNTNATNPTFSQVAAFLKDDPTDKLTYVPGIFVCSNFAERIQNNAENAGYRCGWVAIDFKEDSAGHSCNAFETTDKGLVFIDCTGSINPSPNDTFDTLADLQVDKIYQVTAIDATQNVYYPPFGVVKDYNVYW